MIGLVPKSTFNFTSPNYNVSGWHIYCYDGKFWCSKERSSFAKVTEKKILNNDIVEVEYDSKRKEILFYVNGEHRGGFRNIDSTEDLHPAIDFHEFGSVQIFQ